MTHIDLEYEVPLKATVDLDAETVVAVTVAGYPYDPQYPVAHLLGSTSIRCDRHAGELARAIAVFKPWPAAVVYSEIEKVAGGEDVVERLVALCAKAASQRDEEREHADGLARERDEIVQQFETERESWIAASVDAAHGRALCAALEAVRLPGETFLECARRLVAGAPVPERPAL